MSLAICNVTRHITNCQTQMMQRILSEPQWRERLHVEDLRALTPLVYSHVTPYGTFLLDMSKRLEIEQAVTA